MDTNVNENRNENDSNQYLAYCHNTGTYIYKGQCCKICFEKLQCLGKDLNSTTFNLPNGIKPLQRIFMGNLQNNQTNNQTTNQTTNQIRFDLEHLYQSMVTTGVNPEKSMLQFSEQEMQQLGLCYVAAYGVIEAIEEIEKIEGIEGVTFENQNQQTELQTAKTAEYTTTGNTAGHATEDLLPF